ncbi:hypothetical protein XELAEV_18006208mg, partial [Xenopus laevis]
LHIVQLPHLNTPTLLVIVLDTYLLTGSVGKRISFRLLFRLWPNLIFFRFNAVSSISDFTIGQCCEIDFLISGVRASKVVI